MMDQFRIRPLSESDMDNVVECGGGARAHADAHRREKPSADYVFGEAVIELKLFNDEGLEKPERQRKLADLFSEYEIERPVIVLDREGLPPEGVRRFDRILEGPIKRAASTASKQLAQSRNEHAETTTSILWIINNGYTALDHDALVRMVAHRVRNDTSAIDGVVVSGCYFYSDGFDSFFLWPMHYVPINLGYPFPSYDKLHGAWTAYAEKFMTELVLGQMAPDALKGPVVDTQFEVDEVTYVLPAPPMGAKSAFFANGRPRKNSTGLTSCPPVAVTFPDMSRSEWTAFRQALPQEAELYETHEAWQRHRAIALATGTGLVPFVPMSVTYTEWRAWCSERKQPFSMHSVRQYANDLFDKAIHARIAATRQWGDATIRPSRYVFVQTEEIGQDRANDVSHILIVTERPGKEPADRPILCNARIFYEHAIALAGAYAVAEDIECVLWDKNLRYSWM